MFTWPVVFEKIKEQGVLNAHLRIIDHGQVNLIRYSLMEEADCLLWNEIEEPVWYSD